MMLASLFLALVASASGAAAGSGREDEIAVPVVFWDIHGNPALSQYGDKDDDNGETRGPRRPRFVVGLLGASAGGDDGDDLDGDSTSFSFVGIQHATFDLGNHGETILIAEGCRSCDARGSWEDREVEGFFHSLRDGYGDGNGDDGYPAVPDKFGIEKIAEGGRHEDDYCPEVVPPCRGRLRQPEGDEEGGDGRDNEDGGGRGGGKRENDSNEELEGEREDEYEDYDEEEDDSWYSPCWPSRPNELLPKSSYRLSSSSSSSSSNTFDGDASMCESIRAEFAGYLLDLDDDGGIGGGGLVPVCKQCFGGRSHARFYSLVESDRLLLLDAVSHAAAAAEEAAAHVDDNADVKFTGHHSGAVSAMEKMERRRRRTATSSAAAASTTKAVASLGRSFRFGALVRTTPSIDRIWSNVGIGYRSAFLEQMGSSSFVLRLGRSDDDDDDDGDGGVVESGVVGGTIIFNPNPDRYMKRPSSVVPYHGKEGSNRIHYVKGFVLHSHPGGSGGGSVFEAEGAVFVSSSDGGDGASESPSDDTTDGRADEDDGLITTTANAPSLTTTLFHMDTGNSGISIASASWRRRLAHATGGAWVNKTEVDGDRVETWCCSLAVPSRRGDDATAAANDASTTLFPLPLTVVLSPGDVGVTIPGRGWVTDEVAPAPPSMINGEDVEADSGNGGNQWYYTVFSTYHKNVFGLPFLSAPGVEFVFDDEEDVLRVVGGTLVSPAVFLRGRNGGVTD